MFTIKSKALFKEANKQQKKGAVTGERYYQGSIEELSDSNLIQLQIPGEAAAHVFEHLFNGYEPNGFYASPDQAQTLVETLLSEQGELIRGPAHFNNQSEQSEHAMFGLYRYRGVVTFEE